MPKLVLLVSLLSCAGPVAAGEKAASRPILDELAAEAAALKTRQPERWRQCEKRAEEVFAENEHVVAGWKNRSAPPAPDLTPPKLPLAFLVDHLLNEQPAARRSHYYAYLMAVVHSDDGRRLAALCECRDRELAMPDTQRTTHSWSRFLAEAANLPWAVEHIDAIAADNAPIAAANAPITTIEDNLIYCLSQRFAAKLPAKTRDAAYDYLARHWPQAPHGLPYHPWDVLFRLDAPRARQEILKYYDQTDERPPGAKGKRSLYPYRVSVIHLLREYAGESPKVAAAARKWLAAPDKLIDFDLRNLRVVLLRADPVGELAPAVRHVDHLLAEQVRNGERFESGGDVHALVLAMTQLETPAANREVARYVRQTAIPPGIRLLLLSSLVRQHDEESADLIAHWIREEPEPWPRHLRAEAAKHWDEFGRQALANAGAGD
ncbi:MAG TPA: hypothetical protein VJ783_01675 [Pirellulales bacterium]|nr:hypothetical protein [Pirellulales bacterium]